MTDWLLALVPQYGLWLLAATTFLSCLALPIPASISEPVLSPRIPDAAETPKAA